MFASVSVSGRPIGAREGALRGSAPQSRRVAALTDTALAISSFHTLSSSHIVLYPHDCGLFFGGLTALRKKVAWSPKQFYLHSLSLTDKSLSSEIFEKFYASINPLS